MNKLQVIEELRQIDLATFFDQANEYNILPDVKSAKDKAGFLEVKQSAIDLKNRIAKVKAIRIAYTKQLDNVKAAMMLPEKSMQEHFQLLVNELNAYTDKQAKIQEAERFCIAYIENRVRKANEYFRDTAKASGKFPKIKQKEDVVFRDHLSNYVQKGYLTKQRAEELKERNAKAISELVEAYNSQDVSKYRQVAESAEIATQIAISKVDDNRPKYTQELWTIKQTGDVDILELIKTCIANGMEINPEPFFNFLAKKTDRPAIDGIEYVQTFKTQVR